MSVGLTALATTALKATESEDAKIMEKTRSNLPYNRGQIFEPKGGDRLAASTEMAPIQTVRPWKCLGWHWPEQRGPAVLSLKPLRSALTRA